MKKNVLILLIIILFSAIQTYSIGMDSDTLNFEKIKEEHQTISSAACISANSKGDIAIGFNDDYINVYNNSGKYERSYAFKVDGSYFFELDDMGGIMIFTLRGNKSYYYNEEAELLKTEEFRIGDSEIYYKEHEGVKKLSINENTYEISQRWGYTKLTKIDINGYVTSIYEDGSAYYIKVFMLLFFWACVSVAIIIIIRSVIKKTNTR